MAKLSDIVAKAMKADVKTGIEASAKSAGTVVDKPAGAIGGAAKFTGEAAKLAELGYIAKQLRGGALSVSDAKDLNARGKAIGVTGDLAEALPAGFTGSLIQDIQDELNVAKLFAVKQIKGGVAHDLIALYGIAAYLTSEAATGTDSAENYTTFVATTNKVMSIVRKSYELLDDSLIDVAAEVRSGIVRAVAEAVEETVINGDIAGTQDAGTASNSAVKVSNGLRKTGLGKATVDFTGAALTEDEFLAKITEMQLAGGVYLDQRAVNRGDVVLVIDQHMYGKIRNFNSFKTLDVAGRLATLFGGKIDSVFGIPLVVTSLLPVVNASGVVDATSANNTLSTCVMANIMTCRLSFNGNVISESDKDITNQSFIYTGSLRYGFSSVYDSTDSAPNTIDASYVNVVAGINIAR
jgi:HK97 family phage major capsid protein